MKRFHRQFLKPSDLIAALPDSTSPVRAVPVNTTTHRVPVVPKTDQMPAWRAPVQPMVDQIPTFREQAASLPLTDQLQTMRWKGSVAGTVPPASTLPFINQVRLKMPMQQTDKQKTLAWYSGPIAVIPRRAPVQLQSTQRAPGLSSRKPSRVTVIPGDGFARSKDKQGSSALLKERHSVKTVLAALSTFVALAIIGFLAGYWLMGYQFSDLHHLFAFAI